MELQFQKERWLKIKEEYALKLRLIEELEAVENDPLLSGRKRSLDHQLDAVEHLEREHLTEAFGAFVDALKSSKPELLQDLQAQLSACEQSVKQEAEITTWVEFYQTILPHLEKLTHLRQGSSGFGFIKYLFGMRPTHLMTDEIQKIKQLLQKEKREYINASLKRLHELVQKRWDFKQIDKEYTPLFAALEHEYALLLQAQKKAAETSQAAEKNLHDWLQAVD